MAAAPHRLGGEPGTHIGVDRLERQLRWLRAHYDVLPLRELVLQLRGGAQPRRAAALTFDDAYAGFFTDGWPVLQALGLPATVFVVSGRAGSGEPFWWDRSPVPDDDAQRARRIERLGGDEARIVPDLTRAARDVPASCRPAGWAAIAAAAKAGLEIGAHSVTHRNLTCLDDAELEREVAGCRDAIRERTGAVPEFFAYPYGAWNPRVREAVRRAGYHAALTLDYGLNGASSDPWALRRVNVPASISGAAYQAYVAGCRLRWMH